MKKSLIFSIVIIVLVLLVGCRVKDPDTDASVNPETDATEPVAVNGYRVAKKPSAWSGDSVGNHTDENADKSVTVTFNGKEYTGSYVNSRTAAPTFMHDLHEYKGTDENGIRVQFQTDSITKELQSFAFISLNTFEQEKATLTEDECRAAADAFAGQYISVDEYSVSVEKKDFGTAGDNYYCIYTYCRMAGTYKTTDVLMLFVDGNGNVLNMSMGMLGAFTKEEVDRLSISEEAVNAVLDQEIERKYGEKIENYEYRVTNKTLTKLEDGRYGIIFDVSVNDVSDTDTHGWATMVIITWD